MDDKETKLVSLAEVKSILQKVNKEREDLLYEQRIALEHAQKFAKIPVKKANDLIKELSNLEFLEKHHAVKITDLLPETPDDVRAIFAKERLTLGENEIKQVLEIINKHYIK